MENLDLHSLILEELSEVLAHTCTLPADASASDVLGMDPAVQRIISQCPPLPGGKSGGGIHGGSRRPVNRRHENALLALAKILSQSESDGVRQLLLNRLIEYLDALPSYAYSFSPLGVLGVPTEHWFLEGF
ncbi:hypothetical protein H4R26_005952, partial [Coemansia thaxteri]